MNYLINKTDYCVGIKVKQSIILAWGNKEFSQRKWLWQSPKSWTHRRPEAEWHMRSRVDTHKMSLEPWEQSKSVKLLLEDRRTSGDCHSGVWCSICFFKCHSGHTHRMKSVWGKREVGRTMERSTQQFRQQVMRIWPRAMAVGREWGGDSTWEWIGCEG